MKLEKQKSSANRSALEDEYNFTIVEDKDVKIIEKDSVTYYNILIRRDSVSEGEFENLLIMIENINNLEEASAYIVKYHPEFLEDSYVINVTDGVEHEVDPLFGRVALCTKTCITTCYYLDEDYPQPHSPTYKCIGKYAIFGTYCETKCNTGGGIPGGGPVGSTDNGSGGGGANGGGSGGATPPPPPNNNGAPPPPPELLLDPVVDEPTEENNKQPCKKIKKLIQTTTPTLSSELQSLSSMTNLTTEKGKFSLSNNSSLVVDCTSNTFGELEFPNPPSGSKILYFAHTHNSPSESTYSIFSWEDLENIAIGIKNGQIDNNFVCFVSTSDGTNYAFTISDTALFSKFFAFTGESNFDINIAKRRVVANDLYYGTYDLGKNPRIKENSIDLLGDEKAFLDMVKYAGIGITLFETNSTFTNFESVTHNSLTGELDKKPCN